MDMKPKQRLLTRPNLVILAVGAVLLCMAVLALPQVSSPMAALPPDALQAGLALLAFFCGVGLSGALILRPMHRTYRARVKQLRSERQQLELLNGELYRQASSDGLLGMANRREFERVLELEWRRAVRERQPLGLLMVDVDHFKIFNDTYGHVAGDSCLRQIGKVLESAATRPGDIVARYGGEEIVILMPRTDLDGASHLARRVHALLAERAIAFPDSPIADHVTVSIGATSILPAHKSTPLSLVRQADEGLYVAKENGRNRTEAIPRLRLVESDTPFGSAGPDMASGS